MPKVLFFNEDFVEKVVFKEDEVIENSFEVFLKTADYDQKNEQLDSHLQAQGGKHHACSKVKNKKLQMLQRL